MTVMNRGKGISSTWGTRARNVTIRNTGMLNQKIAVVAHSWIVRTLHLLAGSLSCARARGLSIDKSWRM